MNKDNGKKDNSSQSLTGLLCKCVDTDYFKVMNIEQ